ncbi:MAG: hypothetical protein CL402_04345 [Acidiferrobacteraceae bacterium]|nr:hypothetical protein [Acidiferrobacteraceae bacterium]
MVFILTFKNTFIILDLRIRLFSRMLLILFGTRDRRKIISERYIICPKCEMKQKCDVISLREWITVFFIPIFPTGNDDRKGYFVQCKTCQSVYENDAL